MEILREKKCSQCNEIKPIDQFYKRTDRFGKYRSDCKKCFIMRTNIKNNLRMKKLLKCSAFYKLNNLISTNLREAIRGNFKKSKYEIILGFTLNDLKNRLILTVPIGFQFEDYFNGKLEMDHINPKRNFNFNRIDDPQVKECWKLSNIRLITKKKNRERPKKIA